MSTYEVGWVTPQEDRAILKEIPKYSLSYSSSNTSCDLPMSSLVDVMACIVHSSNKTIYKVENI